MLSNRLYDVLNKSQRWLYLFGVFWLALCEIWNFPLGNEVNQTLVAIGSLLAGVLEISTAQYNKKQQTKNERR